MKQRLLPFLFLPLLLVGCATSKDDNPSPSGPQKYQVTYQISAVNYAQARIIYRDSTGTLVTDENVPLPKTYSFKRTMRPADIVSCGAFPANGDASATVTCAIQLDGQTVDSKTTNGPNPQGVASYLIP